MIAEAAVHYGCVLVTNDVELRESVNLFVPNGAISVEQLLEKIQEISKDKK